MPNDHKLLSAITTFVFDVDGVMTNGQVLVSENGELLRSMNIKDGYALKLAVQRGYRVCIITGGRSEGVRLRFSALGIKDYYSGVHDKAPVLDGYAERHGLPRQELLYVGDDLPDLPAMQACGVSCAPADAVEQVRSAADLVLKQGGGQGCVREIIEHVLRSQGKWEAA